MRATVTVIAIALAVASGGALADAPKTDPVCEKVTSTKERNARLAARNPGVMQRSADPVAEYQRSKLTGNMADGWRSIMAIQAGAKGKAPNPRLADALWVDFWCSEVLPGSKNDSRTYKSIKTAANHGIPTAMIRLSYVYGRGEFGQRVDKRRSAVWRDKYFAALRAKR